MMKVCHTPVLHLEERPLLTSNIVKDKERRKLMKERTGGKHI